MGLFDFFRKSKSKQAEVPAHVRDLPSVSYAIAYFVLPHGIYNDGEKFIAIWQDAPASAGPLFYDMGCQFKGASPSPECASLFRASCGQLDEATDFYLLEYPAPPPMDFTRMFPGKNLAEAHVPVVAPHFSAVLLGRGTGAVSYYVLGQSPVGGTTLRSISKDGVNSNLGPGALPRAEAFLDQLRSLARAAV